MIERRAITADEQWRDDSAMLSIFLDEAQRDGGILPTENDVLLETARNIVADGEEAGFSKLTIGGARVYIERYGEPPNAASDEYDATS